MIEMTKDEVQRLLDTIAETRQACEFAEQILVVSGDGVIDGRGCIVSQELAGGGGSKWRISPPIQ